MSDSILDKVLSSKHAEEIASFSPQEVLVKIFQHLNSRERDVLTRRFNLNGKGEVTLEEIGKTLEVTRERVRQIEQGAIKKVRGGPNFSSGISVVEHVIQQYLEEAGGALSEAELFARLLAGRDRPEESKAIMYFFLHELLRDRFHHIAPEGEFHEGWALRLFSLEQLQRRIATVKGILEEKKEPIAFAALARLYSERNTDDAVSEDHLLSSLQLSTLIEQNAFGEWGLTSWMTVHPKRMRDKIYLVLKRNGKPMHFIEIARLINEAKFDQKVAHAPTVHNELIMDERFVLVGRGTYALQEWGYKPGIVADVVADILTNAGKPLSREAIVAEVLKQRFVGRATVHLALTNRERFEKLPDGTYSLKSQIINPQP